MSEIGPSLTEIQNLEKPPSATPKKTTPPREFGASIPPDRSLGEPPSLITPDKPALVTPEKPASALENPYLFPPQDYQVSRDPEDEEQKSALKIPRPKIGLHLISKGEKIGVAWGIQPDTWWMHGGMQFASQVATLLSLRRRGFDPIDFDPRWESDESWPEKLERSRDFFGSKDIKKGIGESAGATLERYLEAEGRLTRVISLSGWVQRENAANKVALANLKKKAPSFGEAVQGLPDPKNSANFVCFFTEYDERVPAETAQLEGATNIRVKVPRMLNLISPRVPLPIIHEYAIGSRLLVGGKVMGRHFKPPTV